MCASLRSASVNYTAFNLPWVNACIEKHLSLIVENVQRNIPQIDAVILIGGFGREEGSVLLEHDRVIPLNDYDFVLAMGADCDQTQLSDLSHRLSGQIGIRHIDFIPIPTASFAVLPPSQFNYDMKYGGKVLAGMDVLSLIPEMLPSDIPVSDARRLLINRAVCLLEGFPCKQSKDSSSLGRRFFAYYQTAKVILACGEALLIQSGHYDHRCIVRQSILQELFGDRGNFLHWHKFATDFKLRPVREPVEDLEMFWRDTLLEYTRTLCDLVLGPGNWYPAPEALLRCIDYLREADMIERTELEIIFARYLGLRLGWTLMARAAQKLYGLTGVLRTWNQLRQEAIRRWHTAHP